MSPLHTQLLLGTGAVTFLLLIVVRRGLRHTRRIDVTCVSDHWLADHKRQLES